MEVDEDIFRGGTANPEAFEPAAIRDKMLLEAILLAVMQVELAIRLEQVPVSVNMYTFWSSLYSLELQRTESSRKL